MFEKDDEKWSNTEKMTNTDVFAVVVLGSRGQIK